MDDYLPEVTEAPPDAFEGDDDIIREEIKEELEKEEEQAKPKEEPIEPVVETPKKLSQEEVFTTPKVKAIRPLDNASSTAENPAKEKKKKRPMSEKQKAHMTKIRVKGLEALAKRRAEDKKIREAGGIVPKGRRKAKVEAVHDAKVKVEAEKLIVREKEKMTEEDIERISTKAIENYEKLRKARKEQKKKTVAAEDHKASVSRTINRALGTPSEDDDIWAAALGGMMN